MLEVLPERADPATFGALPPDSLLSSDNADAWELFERIEAIDLGAVLPDRTEEADEADDREEDLDDIIYRNKM